MPKIALRARSPQMWTGQCAQETLVNAHLRNTLLALIIPQAATALGLYLLRQSFLGVPKELEEA